MHLVIKWRQQPLLSPKVFEELIPGIGDLARARFGQEAQTPAAYGLADAPTRHGDAALLGGAAARRTQLTALEDPQSFPGAFESKSRKKSYAGAWNKSRSWSRFF